MPSDCYLTIDIVLCYFVAVKNFGLLIWARLLDDLRWAAKHIYSWLILPPIVVAMTYATVARSIHSAPIWNPSTEVRTLLSGIVILCMVGINLSRATAEVFYLRQPESFADSLPVNISTKLHVALVIRISRTFVFGAVVLGVRYLLNGGVLNLKPVIFPVIALCSLAAVTEILSAVNWVHWNATKSKLQLLIAIVIALASIVILAFLGIEIINPGLYLSLSLNQLSATALIVAGLVYLYVLTSHELWRSKDIDYARRLWENKRSSLFDVALWKRFDPTLSSLLARDLQLTVRIFSSAAYIVVILALFWLALLAMVLLSNILPPPQASAGWFAATWLPTIMAAKFVTIFATSSLSILVASLLAAELPQLWVEKVTGVNGLDLLKAKIIYAAIVSFPAPILVWGLTLLTGHVPFFYAVPLLLECLFLWWCASSLIGALSFEMPNQPLMATIFMLTAGTAIPMLMSLAWPIGIGIYVVVMPQLVGRGRARARVYLLGEAD